MRCFALLATTIPVVHPALLGRYEIAPAAFYGRVHRQPGRVAHAPTACLPLREEEDPAEPLRFGEGLSSSAEDEVVTCAEDIIAAGRAWALIYNFRTGNEGIYARHLAETGREMVLLFVEQEAAARYMQMLQANDFPEATAVELDTAELLTFCRASGHQLGLVPQGSLLVPPEENVECFEWTPGSSEEGRESLLASPDQSSVELLEQRRSLEAIFSVNGGDDDAA